MLDQADFVRGGLGGLVGGRVGGVMFVWNEGGGGLEAKVLVTRVRGIVVKARRLRGVDIRSFTYRNT